MLSCKKVGPGAFLIQFRRKTGFLYSDHEAKLNPLAFGIKTVLKEEHCTPAELYDGLLSGPSSS